MMRMPQIFNVSQIRQMMAGTPIYGYNRPGSLSRDYHDLDIEENMEDESNIVFSPSLDDMISQKNNINSSDSDSDGSVLYSGLTGDSLAFTLVYVSVFTITLVYVGIRLARRWRHKHQASRPTALANAPSQGGEESVSAVVLPPCGHAQCARAAMLPYTGLPAAWLPELLSLQPTHNTAVCRGRCGACRDLARPPPSYTKLFLEDQPPAYYDSIVLKDGENTCSVSVERQLPTEPSEQNDSNHTVIHM